MRRLLVVDTSVARSAGETEHPVSSSCRSCLETILRVCHRVVMTPDILAEWKRHESRHAHRWRRSMTARRKVVWNATPKPLRMRSEGLSDRDIAAIEKDRHLLEAAVATDRVIVTRDESLRSALGKAPRNARLAASITWINPVEDGASALEAL